MSKRQHATRCMRNRQRETHFNHELTIRSEFSQSFRMTLFLQVLILQPERMRMHPNPRMRCVYSQSLYSTHESLTLMTVSDAIRIRVKSQSMIQINVRVSLVGETLFRLEES